MRGVMMALALVWVLIPACAAEASAAPEPAAVEGKME